MRIKPARAAPTMIGTKMLGSSTEHSWAADKERVSQQVEQCVRDLKNIVRQTCEAAGQQVRLSVVCF